MKKMIAEIGVEKIDLLFQRNDADVLASKPPFGGDLEKIDANKTLCQKILDEKQPLSRKDLASTGMT
jgi:hypothetical protein